MYLCLSCMVRRLTTFGPFVVEVITLQSKVQRCACGAKATFRVQNVDQYLQYLGIFNDNFNDTKPVIKKSPFVVHLASARDAEAVHDEVIGLICDQGFVTQSDLKMLINEEPTYEDSEIRWTVPGRIEEDPKHGDWLLIFEQK